MLINEDLMEIDGSLIAFKYLNLVICFLMNFRYILMFHKTVFFCLGYNLVRTFLLFRAAIFYEKIHFVTQYYHAHENTGKDEHVFEVYRGEDRGRFFKVCCAFH